MEGRGVNWVGPARLGLVGHLL